MPAFCNLWSIPQDEIDAADNNELYRQMVDLELVLRFFALSEHESMNARFGDYLSVFMEERNKKYKVEADLEQYDRDRFARATDNCWRIFGGAAFVRPGGRRSVPLADAVMVALADVNPANVTDEKAAAVRAAMDELFQSERFTKSFQSVWSKLHASTPANLGDLKIFLTTFIAMRNECAHFGSTNSPPTASDLMQYCKNFEGMGVALLAVLNQQLTELGAL